MSNDDEYAKTPLPQVIWAPMATVERWHLEDNNWKAIHMKDHTAIQERVSRTEWQTQDVEKRLNLNDNSFAKLERLIDSATPKPIPWWKIVGAVVSLATVVGSFIWQLAKYPNREEFANAQKDVAASQTQLRIDFQEMQVETASVKTTIIQVQDSLKQNEVAQRTIDEKLDILLRNAR